MGRHARAAQTRVVSDSQMKPTPTKELHRAVGSQIPLYGITTFGHLFTARQKLTLSTLVRLIGKAEPGEVTRLLLGLSLSRVTDIYNAQGVWELTKTQVRNLFSRQALPMRWDFAEASAFGRQAGDYLTTVETVARVVQQARTFPVPGQVAIGDARNVGIPDQSASIWLTDPPYYDAIPYSDLSDFFLFGSKRVFPEHPLMRDPFCPTKCAHP